MKIVVLYTSTNQPGKADASGAFIPAAKAFTAHYSRAGHEVTSYPIPCSTVRPNRRKTALTALSNHTQIDMLAYFGHGLNKAIQIGFDTSNIESLAKPLRDKGCKTVGLYACSAAEDAKTGFAKVLSDKIPCRVIGHTTAGHAVQNPYVRIYSEDGTFSWAVEPSSMHWEAWKKLLKTDVAYELPVVDKASFLALLGTKDDIGIGIA